MARTTPGGLTAILSYFTRHRTLANLLLVVLVVLGVTAFPNLRAQFFPDVIIDEISVSVRWDGAGSEDVDQAIVQILEPTLLGVEGVSDTTSVSREGQASIELEFEPGWDMSRALDEVESAVRSVTNLPEAAEDPEVRRRAWRDRVTDVVITGPVGVDQLARFADEFSTRLFAEGVTRVSIRGLDAPETIVEVPSIALVEHDITLREIADAIGAEADTNPAGSVSNASRVRTGSARRSPDEIASIVLRSELGTAPLTVGDVARIRVEGVDRRVAFFVGENPAISVRVDRSDRGDAIDIQRVVERVAEEMEATLPQGVSIDLIRTRAEAITARLSILLDNGLLGLALVVALLFLFLNARTAFWVAAGVPVAMTAAIALMYAGGLTLNMVSLFALIITLGIVVDDAIVVGEHADFRARRLGEDPFTAAENAATRMFTPVFAATLTTIIAFFGLVTIGGRFGDLIADIPLTVIAVLAASLVECFLILPNHMAHALAHSAKEHWYDWPSRQVNRGFRWVRETLFRPLMRLVIWARYPVLALAVMLLASQAALFMRGDVQWRFFNAPERGSVSGNFAMLPGSTRADTLEMMRQLQETVAEVGREYEAEHGVNPVDYAVAQIGGTTGRGLAGSDTKDPDQLGSIAIELIDADLRSYSSFEFVARLQDTVINHPKLETLSFRGWRSGPGGEALHVEIFGASATTLKAAAEMVKSELSKFPEVSALEDSLSFDKQELVLDLTPQGQALGYNIDGIGRILRDRLNGIEAATFPDGPRSAAIRVQLPESELTADFLGRTFLRTSGGGHLPLADIVTVSESTGFSTVRRENGLRLISVTGDLSEDDPARAEAVQDSLERIILPAVEERFGVSTELSGLSEQEDRFLSEALLGLMLCLLGIYLTLAWIFESWTRPMVVMAVIPFGLVGAIYGHYAWSVPLSMFSVVGLIGMVGIIINDSIVLVTTIDEKARSQDMAASIIDGAADRLRPVLLTTATTVLGLTPLLYEGSQQAQFLKPTVITLTYGLGFGMFLVLLVVPALLASQRDIGFAVCSFRRALFGGPAPVRLLLGGVGLALAALFAVTVGEVILNGAFPPWLSALLPAWISPSAPMAYGLFAMGSVFVVLVVGLMTTLASSIRRSG